MGDALARLRELPDASAHVLVTSPPYWNLRDYSVAGQLGREATPQEYVAAMVEVFREARRVLRPDATAWINLGDSYVTRWGSRRPDNQRGHGSQERERTGGVPYGLKEKDLLGMPWRVALALQADGWWLRADNVWHKTNPQPEAAEDRPTRDHEYVFLLSAAQDYFYDPEAVREPTTGTAHTRGKGTHRKSAAAGSGVKQNVSFSAAVRGLVAKRNMRTVWSFQTMPNSEAHFATYPVELPLRCILAGTSEVGCCRLCGAPYARLVDKARTLDGEVAELPPRKNQDRGSPDTATGVGHWRTGTATATTGWEATCRCPLGPPVPCTVLDCFGGLMTTGEAALKLGRNFVGVELNPEYAALGERRLLQVAGAHPEHVPAATLASTPPRPVQLALTDRR